MSRFFKWAVGMIVALFALFYIGGGWYFSEQIEAAALEVGAPGPDRGVTVVAVDGRKVTLRAGAEEQPALDTAMTYGLRWEGGFGQISGAPQEKTIDGSPAVARHLTVLEGSKPSGGEEAELDRDAFPEHDPALAVGGQVRDVKYQVDDEELPAWVAPAPGETWVILVHGGRGSDRQETLRAMGVAHRVGMPSMSITYRNDQGAPQDPSGRYQYGLTEWRDLEGAVRYALDHGADNVNLVGFSMGGAITASFLEHSDLAPRVEKVVLDAPMLDLQAAIRFGASQRSLPVIGHLPDSLVWTAEQITAVRDDVDWDAFDYLDDTSWLQVPTLVFHGTDDLTVPVATSRTLKEQNSDLVTLEEVTDANHVEAWNVDPKDYESMLAQFLRS